MLTRDLGLSPFDLLDYLISEEDIAAYLDAVREDGDEAEIAKAELDAARARERIAANKKPPSPIRQDRPGAPGRRSSRRSLALASHPSARPHRTEGQSSGA